MDREQTVSMVTDVFHFYATVIQWRLREVFFFLIIVYLARNLVLEIGVEWVDWGKGGGGLISVGYSTAGYSSRISCTYTRNILPLYGMFCKIFIV